jgi:hypothetical protein
MRAQQYREKGALDGLVPRDWTAALIDGLQILDRLDYEEWQLDKPKPPKGKGGKRGS